MANKIKLTIQETVEANTVTIITQTTTVNVAEFLNVDVAGGLSESDIDTFAKLDTIVADKSLVNLEDAQSFSGVKTFNNGLNINADKKLILDSDGDEWTFLLHDDADVFGFNNGFIYGAAGGGHHFIEGETSVYAPVFSSGYNVGGKTDADVVLAGGGTASYGTVVATGTVIDLSIKDSEYNQVTPLTDYRFNSW